MQRKKKDTGITLVALVITIIVLLILAGITLSLTMGQNGIIVRAQEADIKNQYATVLEAMKMQVLDIEAEKTIENSIKLRSEYLIDLGYMDVNGVVNTSKLLGNAIKTGNGSNGKDVYQVKDGVLSYYDKEGTKIELGEIYQEEVPTAEEYFDFDVATGTISLKDAVNYTEMIGTVFPITKIVVPTTYQGHEVKIIGNFTYANIEEVSIPYGVVKINDQAFAGTKIKKVSLPNSLTQIGSAAFYSCKQLQGIVIPNSVTTIGDLCFELCISMESVTLSENIETLETSVFSWNESLKQIVIPNSVKVIKNKVFEHCISLTSIVLPEGLTRIEQYAFSACNQITTITIPKNVTQMQIGVFEKWGSHQTIQIYHDPVPSGWSASWNNQCEAVIQVIS